MSDKKYTKTSYADAGVSIERGNTLVDRIKPHTKRTLRPEVMGNIGGFGGLFDISGMDYKNPVLVSGTDGVGTKINLAIETNQHDTIGIDLVAMCVNDLLVSGAEPLFFLDYFACSQLDVDIAERVVKGIAEGCSIAGCSLIGGETAEMPGMYRPGEYDLAGFCVGIVEQSEIIDGTAIEPGDFIIGLSSSGPHANGYSLIRKILKDTDADLNETVGNAQLVENLLAPTRIYVNSIRQLIKKIRVKGMAHITGGGFLENIPRILPEGTSAVIKNKTWTWPEIFYWLQARGNIDEMEMYRTFNCGVGMILIVNKNDADTAIEMLEGNSENAWVIGNIQKQEISNSKVIFE